jgi:hypothetical protein
MLFWKVWCLIQNPNSLCAIILKAQYFPDCHILDAKPAKNMSYTWTSILHGVDLVKKRCGVAYWRWEQFDIWQDLWIPRAWYQNLSVRL